MHISTRIDLFKLPTQVLFKRDVPQRHFALHDGVPIQHALLHFLEHRLQTRVGAGRPLQPLHDGFVLTGGGFLNETRSLQIPGNIKS